MLGGQDSRSYSTVLARDVRRPGECPLQVFGLPSVAALLSVAARPKVADQLRGVAQLKVSGPPEDVARRKDVDRLWGVAQRKVLDPLLDVARSRDVVQRMGDWVMAG